VVRVDVSSVRLSAPAASRASASLRVSGPPVAREVRFEASHAWIAVAQTASGAELSVTAGESGTRQGKVVVTGPTGDVVVAVEIEAVPVAEPEPEPGPVAEPQPEFEPGPVAEPQPVAEEPEQPAGQGPAAAAAPGPVASGPVVAAASEPEPRAVPEPGPMRTPEPGSADPVAGTAGIVAIAGAVFAVTGLGLDYRYGEYSLAEYRPGMQIYAVVVAVCAVLAGILTLAPRTRQWVGPALLLGVGFGALFGLLRFLGEMITLADGSGTELGAGFAFELLAHLALVVAAACALAALRRAGRLGAGKVSGWEAWVAIVLGLVVASGWITQLAELSEHDTSESGRVAAYYILGALLVVALTVFAAILRPRPVGAAVLATGTVGLAGVLAPTIAGLVDYSSLTFAGATIAVSGLVLLAVDIGVLVVRLQRNQPIERQS
jgi:hypothetical protein